MPDRPAATIYAAYGQTIRASTRDDTTLVIGPPWAQVAITGDPGDAQDRFELRTTDDEAFAQTVAASAAVAAGDERSLLRVTDLEPGRDVTLLHHDGATEPTVVFWRRPYASVVNGADAAETQNAAAFAAARFVQDASDGTAPLTACTLYLACTPGPAETDAEAAGIRLTAYAADASGQYRRVPVWPDDEAPTATAQSCVLLDLAATGWHAATAAAPLDAEGIAALWAERLDGAAGRAAGRWVPFEPAPLVVLPVQPSTEGLFSVRLEALRTRIPSPLLSGAAQTIEPLVEIKVERLGAAPRADRAEIRVYDGDRLLLTEMHTDLYVAPGRHAWAWNGCDEHGTFDTRVRLRVDVGLIYGEATTTASVEIPTEAGPMDWADLRFDRAAKRVDVMFHVDVQNEGYARWIPLVNQPAPTTTGPPMPDALFEHLRQITLDGISRHWSRTGPDGLVQRTGPGTFDQYDFHTTALLRSREPSLDVDLYVNESRDRFARGVNPLLWDLSVFYNLAAYARNGSPTPARDADADFAETAAHEVGHTVLAQTRSLEESITHHGTTTIFQTRRRNAPATGSGEVDLMRYYPNRYDPARAVVSHGDALALYDSFHIRTRP